MCTQLKICCILILNITTEVKLRYLCTPVQVTLSFSLFSIILFFMILRKKTTSRKGQAVIFALIFDSFLSLSFCFFLSLEFTFTLRYLCCTSSFFFCYLCNSTFTEGRFVSNALLPKRPVRTTT